MGNLSSNARARTSELYRMGFFGEYENIVKSCAEQDFASDSEHIDFHKPELYAMLSHLVNETVRTSLELRDKRGEYGLVLPAGRVLMKRPHDVSRILVRTLNYDAHIAMETYQEVTDEIDPLLQHVQRIDRTSLDSTPAILSGGITTMITRFDLLHKAIDRGIVPTADGDKSIHWRALLDQTHLSIPELVSLDQPFQLAENLYEVDERGAARFCKHAIVLSQIAQEIPERETIGCPISFEPALVRDLWQWYVELKDRVAEEKALEEQVS